MKNNILLFLFLLTVIHTNSQKLNLSTENIPQEFKENANSVVREQVIGVEIKSISNMIVKTYKVTTVFNENGLKNIDAIEYYDNTRTINDIEAIVYDKYSNEIKKIKRKDFLDQSVAGDAADISDTRALFLNYVPTTYPFTIVYKSEIQTSNTAFIPSWYPVDDYYESVMSTSFNISYPSDLGFKFKEMFFEENKLQKDQGVNYTSFKQTNISAEKPEDLSSKKFSYVLFGLDKFKLEGVEGNATSWKEFGLWMNERLLKNSIELPEETRVKIKKITENISNPIEKARKVYEYVQNKTRYVSIQLGIGGWKPMLAKNVDRLGYGDCKALSNYTKALLEVAGVPSYYTVIYGGYKNDIQEDFVSMQGNHVVLAIPDENKNLRFLECTSQTQAFGFEGSFTNDRLALVIKPEGGEIIRTKNYIEKDNSQLTNINVFVRDDSTTLVNLETKSFGLTYNYIKDIENKSAEKIKDYYKDKFGEIPNLKVENYQFQNDKNKIMFTEKINLFTDGVVKSIGEEKMMKINLFNPIDYTPQRYRTRKTGFKIENGAYEEDVVIVEFDKKYTLKYIPEATSLVTEYGEYTTELQTLEKSKIKYTRKLLIKKGNYPASQYEEFRLFCEQIAKYDNAKIIFQ